jgi:hypothetical protein
MGKKIKTLIEEENLDLNELGKAELEYLESIGKIFYSSAINGYKLVNQLIPVSDTYFPLK